MKRKLAQLTEWAWGEGMLSDSSQIQSFVMLNFFMLSRNNPNSKHNSLVGIEELKKDIMHTLRVLSYGGRTQVSLHPDRRAYLQHKVHKKV